MGGLRTFVLFILCNYKIQSPKAMKIMGVSMAPGALSEPLSTRRSPVGAALRWSGPCRSRSPLVWSEPCRSRSPLVGALSEPLSAGLVGALSEPLSAGRSPVGAPLRIGAFYDRKMKKVPIQNNSCVPGSVLLLFFVPLEDNSFQAAGQYSTQARFFS